MKNIIFSLVLLFFSVFAYAADRVVAVTILPQKYITEKIAGNLWTVISVIPEGANPHTYEPKPDILKQMSRASAYFSLEQVLDEIWLKKILQLNRDMKLYRVDKGIDKIEMRDHDHQHGKKLFYDPHIWLSIENMKKVVLNTRDAFIDMDPSNKNIYEKNSNELIKEIDNIKNEITNRIKDKKNKSFLVFHPAWGYFAKDFGLNQVAVEFEGKEPSPKRLKEIISFAKGRNIRVIFVQPQISSSTVETLSKELNAKVVRINPLEYNWLDNMKNVSQKIAEGLE